MGEKHSRDVLPLREAPDAPTPAEALVTTSNYLFAGVIPDRRKRTSYPQKPSDFAMALTADGIAVPLKAGEEFHPLADIWGYKYHLDAATSSWRRTAAYPPISELRDPLRFPVTAEETGGSPLLLAFTVGDHIYQNYPTAQPRDLLVACRFSDAGVLRPAFWLAADKSTNSLPQEMDIEQATRLMMSIFVNDRKGALMSLWQICQLPECQSFYSPLAGFMIRQAGLADFMGIVKQQMTGK